MKKPENRRRRRKFRPSAKSLVLSAAVIWAIWHFKGNTPDDPSRSVAVTAEPPPPASFTHEVRPVLATRCYSCHCGPQGTPPRLDTPEISRTFLIRKSPTGGLGLPADEIHQDLLSLRESSLLMRWRDGGAKHEPHWAFQALPPRLTPPASQLGNTWARNGIDQFHLQHLAKTHTRPVPPADPLTLLRRVSIDLSGLPPRRGKIEELLASEDPDQTYSLRVAELLGSPEFGKAMSDMWLESTFFATLPPETTASPAPLWRWRDWVVNSFNRNRPIDEFLRLQLAGDLVLPFHPENALATSIFRAPLRESGRALSPGEQLKENVDDRIFRLGHTFLGFPLCDPKTGTPHLNPVDPRDLATLRALFTVTGETGLHTPGTAPGAPTALLSTPAQNQILQTTQTKLAHLEALIAQHRREGLAAFEDWLDTPDKIPSIPDLTGLFSCDAPGTTLPNLALGQPGTGTAPTALAAPGVVGNALVLGGGHQASFQNLSATNIHTPWTISLWVRLLTLDRPTTILRRAESGESPERFSLDFSGHGLTAGWHRDGPTQSLLVSSPLPFEQAREWIHLTWTCDGSGQADGLHLYLQGQEVPLTTEADSLPVPLFGAEPGPALTSGSSEKESGSFLLDELHTYSRALTPLEIQHLQDQQSLTLAFADPVRNHEQLGAYYFSSISEKERTLRKETAKLRQESARLRARLPEVSVLRGGHPEPSARKLFESLFSPDLCPTLSSRLDLAQWITRENHPLTARVFVNRVWAHFFGEGLAPSGFGLEGATVSQPDLLDWLARDFIAHGWDLKHLCRQIVLSETYRQSHLAPTPFPRRTQRDILLALCDSLAPPTTKTFGAPDQPWRHLYLSHLPRRQEHWQPTPPPTQALWSEEALARAARQITRDLLQQYPDDDRAVMRELFLRFRCRDDTHPEFEILMGLLELHKESFQGKGDEVPQLVLGAGIDSAPETDPREWAAWVEICTALLSDENLLRRQ